MVEPRPLARLWQVHRRNGATNAFVRLDPRVVPALVATLRPSSGKTWPLSAEECDFLPLRIECTDTHTVVYASYNGGNMEPRSSGQGTFRYIYILKNLLQAVRCSRPMRESVDFVTTAEPLCREQHCCLPTEALNNTT